jgi:hypothetical protein
VTVGVGRVAFNVFLGVWGSVDRSRAGMVYILGKTQPGIIGV